jgi:Ala-tRNA(Pro) deacylase
MSMSSVLKDCLQHKGSQYDVVQHPHSFSSMSTAEAAHIPGDRLAKTVVLGDSTGYAAAVLPSTHHLRLSELRDITGRQQLELATESEVRELFKDCELGAVPPVTVAYGMPTYLDETLTQQPDVYFEAGDHEELIHMRTDQFLDLMENTTRMRCAHRMM